MSRRYGRNQKRKHRERIAELEHTAFALKMERNDARLRLVNAKDDALKYFATKHGLLADMFSRMGHELGRFLAEELNQRREEVLGILRPQDTLSTRFEDRMPMQAVEAITVSLNLRPIHVRRLLTREAA